MLTVGSFSIDGCLPGFSTIVKEFDTTPLPAGLSMVAVVIVGIRSQSGA